MKKTPNSKIQTPEKLQNSKFQAKEKGRLQDEEPQVAIVTGGARGIGLGIARALARERFRLVLCGVRERSVVESTLAELSRAAEVTYVQADVADSAARQRLIDATRERFGGLNVLVNNAGVAPKERADILDATEESFERLVKVNLQGPYFLTQLCARWMIDQKKADERWKGCIVNITSISAAVASVNRGDYCISKAGAAMATQLWAARLGEFGIPAYEIRPGIIKTDMTAGVEAKYDKLISEGLLLESRWGAPDDIGKVAAALARGDLPYSTGQVLCVDGGLTVRRL